jgi:predicted RNase H-like HicB family nuclease
MNEIVFEITQDADGGFSAECLTESIFTQGDNWEELRANVKKAVDGFYFDHAKPKNIRLHLVRDEMLQTA